MNEDKLKHLNQTSATPFTKKCKVLLEVEAVKCEGIKVEYVNTTVLVCVLCA